MKLSSLMSLAGLMTILSAGAIVPKVDYVPRSVIVNEVERLDTCTRVSVTLQNFAKYWVRIPESTFLHAVGDTTVRYRIKGEENLPLGKKIKMPASGLHQGVLIFERVPDDVNVVDMVIDDINKTSGNVLGIHLDEEMSEEYPKLLTAADIFNSKERPVDKWTGFDSERYKDLAFYNKNGIAHLRGRIVDYTPRAGFSTFTVRTTDYVKDGKGDMTLGEINPDGTFALDIPLTYPQYDYLQMGNINRNIFLIPGDTLTMVISMRNKVVDGHDFVPECFGFEGDLDDGIAINLLADSVREYYNLGNLHREMRVEKSDSMAAMSYAVSERLGTLLDSVVTDLPTYLGSLPISGFAKDILSVTAIGEIAEVLEDTEMDFRHTKGPSSKKDDEGFTVYVPGEQLDMAVFLAPHKKNIALLYDNPLLLCKGMPLPNRWAYGSLFFRSGPAAMGMVRYDHFAWRNDTVDTAASLRADIARLDSLGLGKCFVSQLVRTNYLDNRLGQEVKKEMRPFYKTYSSLVVNNLKQCDYAVLNDILMTSYADFISRLTLLDYPTSAANGVNIDTSAFGGVLERIIAPYRGNILYLDFWGIGCGPCRAGMLNQKPLLKEYADKPFKALYIANGDENRSACEKWMRENEIDGEHIFLSGDDWRRMQDLFNFSGIPFGAIVNKEGKVIQVGVHSIYKELIEKLLSQN